MGFQWNIGLNRCLMFNYFLTDLVDFESVNVYRKKEPAVGKKEKVTNCIVVADSICATSIRYE